MSKFKNDIGMFLLQGLFFEVSPNKDQVVYTLKDRDHNGYPSLYRLYMECNDPTEYTFATKHLDGWAHWERLSQCTWFQPYIDRWRRELELRFKALALQRIHKAAQAGGKESFQADKFLVNGGWKDPSAKKRGAPTKAEVKSEAHRIALEQSTLEDDFERITGNLN
jgi:hypothetical protein